jgi:tRNA dimethylallyltransferase
VGGTGLYFKALLRGLAPIPPVPDAIRAYWRDQAKRTPAPELHAVLAQRDPQTAARLRATDPQRIVRALEVLEATGKSLSAWQQDSSPPLLHEEDTIRLVLTAARAELYGRAEKRVDAMIAAGALEEVRSLSQLGLSPDLPIMRATGLAPLLAHLRGDLSFAAAVDTFKRDTRRYIKRQLTWLRGNMIAWSTLATQQMESASEATFPFIDH